MRSGVVYLVGAGPGDPGLLTMRGAECIRRAEVLVYDRLAHPELLRLARPDSEKIFAGKESSHHTLTQPEINALLVEKACGGKAVCRLKGGDPFVFGRGGEEAEACRAAGVPFEIVPGVTSAIAAPAYAGIPVTHRDFASSFAVITGHERAETSAAGEAEQRRGWPRIAHAADTLIFLMGVENLSEIAGRLMENGRAPETPVALVRWGTRAQQETLVSTLCAVVRDVEAARFGPPAVLVIGEVVRLRESLRWFDDRPLFGKRVLVTRAREQASALSGLLREQGAEPVEFPAIRIAPLDDYSALDSALRRMADRQTPFAWVVFTSANGVQAVFARLRALRLDARAFAQAKIAAIGPATADALAQCGLTADFVPSRFVAECAAEEWPEKEMQGYGVLMPRAKEARDVLPDFLRQAGAVVEVIPAYETVLDSSNADSLRQMLAQGAIHAVTFTSSSTVKNLAACIGETDFVPALSGVVIACIGPVTAQTAREMGLTPHVLSEEHTLPGLVEALAAHFAP